MNSFSLTRMGMVASICLGMIIPNISWSQGSLTPPGPPIPTMKTLDQVEPRTLINSIPTTITVSGSYYLSQNLTGIAGNNGIAIEVDNVSIDLCGFSLKGVTDSKTGIYVSGSHNNLTIFNGIVSGWEEYGIKADTSQNNHISDLQVLNNKHDGISLGGRSIVARLIAADNYIYGVSAKEGSLIMDSSIRDNGVGGIEIHGRDCIIRNCSVASNGITNPLSLPLNDNAGIWIGKGECTVVGCTIIRNDTNGILSEEHGHFIEGNTISGNHGDGFDAAGIILGYNGPIHNCRVRNNNICSNDLGISVKNAGTAGNNLIIQNTFTDNTTTHNIGTGHSYGAFVDVSSGGSFGSTNAWANIIY